MRLAAFAMLALLSAKAMAQSEGFYSPLSYRADDPFVFCTQGQKNPDKCWIPVAPYLGQYAMLPHCDPPNSYGKPWTSDDHASLAEYLLVCPKAMKSGTWKGKGTPENKPRPH